MRENSTALSPPLVVFFVNDIRHNSPFVIFDLLFLLAMLSPAFHAVLKWLVAVLTTDHQQQQAARINAIIASSNFTAGYRLWGRR